MISRRLLLTSAAALGTVPFSGSQRQMPSVLPFGKASGSVPARYNKLPPDWLSFFWSAAHFFLCIQRHKQDKIPRSPVPLSESETRKCGFSISFFSSFIYTASAILLFCYNIVIFLQRFLLYLISYTFTRVSINTIRFLPETWMDHVLCRTVVSHSKALTLSSLWSCQHKRVFFLPPMPLQGLPFYREYCLHSHS